MKPRLELRSSELRSSRSFSLASPRTFHLKTLWTLALAGVALAAPAAMRAQQPYAYGAQDGDPQAQYPQQYPQQPYAQPQYQQPQYAQPQYQQPQYGQQQPVYPQPGNGYGRQPDGQYADQNQPNGQPYNQPYGQMPDLSAQQPAGPTQAPLSAAQLEQLLAPIALYPDNLLAQILAASTYPEQVAAADQWVHQMQSQGYGAPEQIAAGAQSENGWDPSVKGLTAFPQVLDMLNQNLQWTTALGNAYYNQPQDVMQTVQVLRQRAQQAGDLESTPQEQVSDDQGYIDVAPANPEVVYVPEYNPWNAYGTPIAPYPGYSVLGALGSFFGGAFMQFGPGIAMAAFDRFPFGWIGWGLNWLGHAIFFNHSAYYTHSMSVADWGFPHGGQRVFGPRPWPGNINHGPRPYGGAFAAARGGYGQMNTPRNGSFGNGSYGNGPYGRGLAPTHPEAPGQQAYNRNSALPSHPQPYAGGEGYARSPYGAGYTGRPAENFGNRPAMGYTNSAPAYRSPSYPSSTYPSRSYAAPAYREPAFQQPQYRAPEMNSSRAFAGRNESAYGDFARNDRSEGMRNFGGGRESKSFRNEGFGGGHAPKSFGHERAPKAPKEGHSGGSHGHWR
jgi:hypothetical protein